MRVYWINEFEKGSLGMMSRPRGHDWLEGEIIKLKKLGVTSLISLLEKEEEFELGIEKEKHICKQQNIDFTNYPIKDRKTPENANTFFELISEIVLKLKNDEKIIVHCRMGIGRTSLVIAGVLLSLQIKNIDEVFNFLSEKRTLKVPDTEEQITWIAEKTLNP
jgi:protein-tyrosine phosphatase